MITELVRDYPGPDWYLMEQSQTLKDLFDDDLANFTGFDTSLTAAFGTAWQTLIDNAVNYKDDTTVSADLGTQAGTVEQAMQACREVYMDIIYFAEQAFGNNAAVLRGFGKGTAYKQASNAQGRMFNFMDELSQIAVRYQAELVAAGCPAATITNIATVRDAFQAANREQNKSVKDRPVITQGRLAAYNALYAATRKVIDAAQRVYRNNAAKLGQYTYSPLINHNNTDTATGTINPETTALVIELPYLATRQLALSNTGTVSLTFALSLNGTTSTGTPVVVDPGNSLAITTSDLGPSGNFIVVTNLNTTTAGDYEVEYEL